MAWLPPPSAHAPPSAGAASTQVDRCAGWWRGHSAAAVPPRRTAGLGSQCAAVYVVVEGAEGESASCSVRRPTRAASVAADTPGAAANRRLRERADALLRGSWTRWSTRRRRPRWPRGTPSGVGRREAVRQAAGAGRGAQGACYRRHHNQEEVIRRRSKTRLPACFPAGGSSMH